MFEIQRSANLKIFEDAHLQICYLDDLELLKLTTCPMVSVIAGSFNLNPLHPWELDQIVSGYNAKKASLRRNPALPPCGCLCRSPQPWAVWHNFQSARRSVCGAYGCQATCTSFQKTAKSSHCIQNEPSSLGSSSPRSIRFTPHNDDFSRPAQRCTLSAATLSASHFAQWRGCFSQRGDLSLQALGTKHWTKNSRHSGGFNFPSSLRKKKEPLQVSPHESRTKNSSDFNLRCSLPFALSMWVADLYHPEILTGRHICCDRLQVQNGVPENHRSLLELRAIPHCILIHFCTCVWT